MDAACNVIAGIVGAGVFVIAAYLRMDALSGAWVTGIFGAGITVVAILG